MTSVSFMLFLIASILAMTSISHLTRFDSGQGNQRNKLLG